MFSLPLHVVCPSIDILKTIKNCTNRKGHLTAWNRTCRLQYAPWHKESVNFISFYNIHIHPYWTNIISIDWLNKNLEYWLVFIVELGDLVQIQLVQGQGVLSEYVLEVMDELLALATRVHHVVPHQLYLSADVGYEHLVKGKSIVKLDQNSFI